MGGAGRRWPGPGPWHRMQGTSVCRAPVRRPYHRRSPVDGTGGRGRAACHKGRWSAMWYTRCSVPCLWYALVLLVQVSSGGTVGAGGGWGGGGLHVPADVNSEKKHKIQRCSRGGAFRGRFRPFIDPFSSCALPVRSPCALLQVPPQAPLAARGGHPTNRCVPARPCLLTPSENPPFSLLLPQAHPSGRGREVRPNGRKWMLPLKENGMQAHDVFSHDGHFGLEGGGGWHKASVLGLFAFGGAYWPLATAHSDPLWARTCFGCVNGAPG